MTDHGITCGSPRCPYLREGRCHRARPTGYQPDLRRNEYWSIWPTVDPNQDYCGEHPTLSAFSEIRRRRDLAAILKAGEEDKQG